MIESLAKTAEIAENKKTGIERSENKFDPDKRIEPKKEIEAKEPSSTFDPDRRVESLGERIDILAKEYVKDLLDKVTYPDSLKGFSIDSNDLKHIPVEQQGVLRKEFGRKKGALRSEWGTLYGKEWPRYTEDVIDKNGNVIRHKGDAHDAHHKVPLCLGGTNTAENITPISAELHYDRRGVHETDSPCSKLISAVKGAV